MSFLLVAEGSRPAAFWEFYIGEGHGEKRGNKETRKLEGKSKSKEGRQVVLAW